MKTGGDSSEAVLVQRDDLRLSLLGLFRYSLGRRSYMPSFVMEILEKHIEVFSDWDIQDILLKEIREWIGSDRNDPWAIGAFEDEWKLFIRVLENEIMIRQEILDNSKGE